MNEWKNYKLAELYDISSGLSKSADEFGFGFPFLSFSNVFRNYFIPDNLNQLVNSSEKDQFTCSIKKGDVFLTRTSETIEDLGMSCVALKDYPHATFNGFTKRLRPKSDKYVCPRFIGYYLRSAYFRAEITAYSSLTTRASLNNEIIERLTVKLPNLLIQKKIASILSTYDYLINNNNQRIRLLEEMAEEIYKEWFVRMRFPGYQDTAFFDKNGKEVPFGTEGALPKDWKLVKINDLYKTSSGGTPSRKQKEYYEGGTINWVKTGELNDRFIFHTSEKITKNAIKNSSAKIFPENTVLIAMYGATIGKLGIIANPSSSNQACCAFLQKTEYFQMEYIFFFLKQLVQHLETISMGAAQQNISQEIIKNVPILRPTDNVLKEFNKIVSPILLSIKNIQEKNKVLQQTRDLLLPRLISGKLDVAQLSESALAE